MYTVLFMRLTSLEGREVAGSLMGYRICDIKLHWVFGSTITDEFLNNILSICIERHDITDNKKTNCFLSRESGMLFNIITCILFLAQTTESNKKDIVFLIESGYINVFGLCFLPGHVCTQLSGSIDWHDSN